MQHLMPVSKKRPLSLSRTLLSATALTALLASPVSAGDWSDHTATVGSISIDTSTPLTTNITQNTDFARVRGNASIDAGWTVNVLQPGATSKYVVYDNRVDPTTILGTLNANGEIYIFDRNGVVFGKGSRVDVGSLIVSTGNVTNADLQDNDGVMTFRNISDAGIELSGSITVADAGLAAFVSPFVTNNGVINAKMGKVAMAAGERVTLDLYGDNLIEIALNDRVSDALLENKGTINAEGGTVAVRAEVAKSVVDTVINMAGVVNASSATVEGGKIVLGAGKNGRVKLDGRLNASGTTGGKIDVSGNNLVVTRNGRSIADGGLGTGGAGNGGQIDLIAQNHMDFQGSLSARGGANGGNGGNAEVSGYKILGYTGNADLSAAMGDVGTLLLDPEFAVIHNVYPRDYRARAYVIADWALANAMRTANVVVQADRFIDVGARTQPYNTGDARANWVLDNLTGPDEINLRDFGTWTFPRTGMQFNVGGTTQGSVTFQSNRVNFNHDVTMGDGNIAVDANIVNLDARLYNPDGVTPLGDSRLSSNAGTVNVRSNDALIQQGVWLADDAGGATVNVARGRYTEQVVINKNLTLQGQGAGRTILRSPRNMDVSYVQDGRENRAIVYVHDADNVNIDGFTINGRRNIDADYTDDLRFIGVAYQNAGGNFTNNFVRNIATPGNTARSGFALLASAKGGKADSVLNISNNRFENFQTYGIAAVDPRLVVTITDNDIVGAGEGSGIFAGFGVKSLTIGGSDPADGNRISNVDYGIETFRASSALIQNNEITNVMNGIDVSDGRGNQILDNTITAASEIGIILRNNSQNTTVSGNTVSGAKMGIVSSIFGRPNGTVLLSGNILTNNQIGMLLRTGTIDLTGAANQITGGERGMVFDPTPRGNPARLSLVGNTIGNTIFNSQSVYFIELLNGALFAPGNPTLLDARLARFNSISASDDPSFELDALDYNAIGDKIWHFVQDNTLGLFDFGTLRAVLVPLTTDGGDNSEIEQEQVFRFFSQTGLQTSGLNVTINGLPNTGTGGGGGGQTPQGLNNITPFAGGDPSALNQISPAAGGETGGQQQTGGFTTPAGGTSFACWGDAGGQAGQGVVNVSYGSSLEAGLASASSCGSAI